YNVGQYYAFYIYNGFNNLFVFVLGVQTVIGKDYYKDHFENCICTDYEVECHYEKKLSGDITKLLHYIKDDVTSITITDSNLQKLPANTFGSCRHDMSLELLSLKTVDLSNNNISTIHRKTFHCFPNLETLILKNNNWKISNMPFDTNYFASLPSLKYLDLTNTFYGDWDDDLQVVPLARIFGDSDYISLETLELSNNKQLLFTDSFLSTNVLCHMPALKALNLDNNDLHYALLPMETGCLDSLEMIDYSYNQIQALSVEFMNKLEQLQNLRFVKLDHNPFVCDCRLITTYKWLNETTVPVNKSELNCTADEIIPRIYYKPIIDLSMSDLVCLDSELNSALSAEYNIAFLILFAVCSVLFK
ncbi:trophoblast glycoprotein-like, partial [Ruditapes philippinarum]|uniref:trophoblast glycoprotein-like n=1 Tax=Ruditapes philippinarum TaxID=129788 RepID=UPI00295ACC88